MDTGSDRAEIRRLYLRLGGASHRQLRLAILQERVIMGRNYWRALLVLALGIMLLSSSCQPEDNFGWQFGWGLLFLVALVLLAFIIIMRNGNNHK